MENEHRALPPFDTRPAFLTSAASLPRPCSFSLLSVSKKTHGSHRNRAPSSVSPPTPGFFGYSTVAHRRRYSKINTNEEINRLWPPQRKTEISTPGTASLNPPSPSLKRWRVFLTRRSFGFSGGVLCRV
uniref:Uncharacterized protein n=1 Tax=Opuntia streptacantha TaxID=393608 RepID=A0A7C8YQ28_OPUST